MLNSPRCVFRFGTGRIARIESVTACLSVRQYSKCPTVLVGNAFGSLDNVCKELFAPAERFDGQLLNSLLQICPAVKW